MWFDLLMDDCKASLELSHKYKGVFVPVFLKLILTMIMGTFVIISVITSVASGVFSGLHGSEGLGLFMQIIAPFGFFLIAGYILYLILWALIEVGSINLYRAALSDEKPSKIHFFSGIKDYLKKVAAGKMLIHFLCLILSPLLLAFFVLYAVIIGIPTAGWGVIFLTVGVSAYFATWTIAIVNDDLGILEGFGTSFKLAKRHFKPLFVIMLALTMISQYAAWLVGPLGFVFAGWFLGGIVKIYFRIVTYKTYLRYQKDIPELDQI